jgi:hypothetical protein
MVEIRLTKGKVAIVDDCDAHLARFSWRAQRDRNRWYALRTGPRPDRKTIYLHREVLGVTDPAIEVDHESGDGLDCRRGNLRRATNAQNQANRPLSRCNTSGFKGVSWRARSRRWRAQIGRRKHLGCFATLEEAARAYDAAALERYGAFARLNFPSAAR